MKSFFIFSTLFILLFAPNLSSADDGYNLWLNYFKVSSPQLGEYQKQIKEVLISGESPTIELVRNEIQIGLNGMMGNNVPEVSTLKNDGLVIGKFRSSALLKGSVIENRLKETDEEGFLILSQKAEGKNTILITANSEIGVLYGTFHFLQMLQTGSDIRNLNILSSPKIKLRILNHWDNLNGSIERDYARANASLGINAKVLNNVNANPAMLTPEYLEKVTALANVFRPYGLKVFLSVKFSSPVNIGGLDTADPLVPEVQEWWKKKVAEVYSYIPDFGGFLVKANSEGQPGPQNYHRTHAEGANMLADALKPFGGILMWRAFVYDNNVPDDRAKQAVNEFKPLDGQFRDNVLIQVKNGAMDFSRGNRFSRFLEICQKPC